MLTSRGFYINKNNLNPSDYEKIANDLTVRPEVYVGQGPIYKLYNFTKEYVNLPRHYAINNFVEDKSISNVSRKLSTGDSVDFEMTLPFKELTNEQKKAFPYIIKAFRQYSTCILKLPCGHGKTVLSIYLAQKIKRKTLLVVHRVNLLEQWEEEIKRFTNATVGYIHGKRFETDCDFILTTIHNILNNGRKEKWQNAYKKIGMLLIDESHHLCAEEFCKVLKVINIWYMIGLTATPNKGERTKIDHVFKQFLGPIVPPENIIDFSEKPNEVIVTVIKYNIPAENPELDKQLMIEFAGKPNTAQMISNISINNLRNNYIVDLLKELIEDKDRKILVVGDRISMLKFIKTRLMLDKIESGLFIGGMKKLDREKSKEKNIILGTYGVCEEGLNIRELNTLIIGTPRRQCEQMVGRVLRKSHSIPVIIIDIWDMFSKTFVNQGRSRQRYYKKKKYVINVEVACQE